MPRRPVGGWRLRTVQMLWIVQRARAYSGADEQAAWACEESAAMGVLSKFEAAMQGVVEGSFGRVFRARLQPAELANKLTRALEDNLQIGSDRRLAPNVYDVYLSRRDYEHFHPTFDSLQRRMADALIAVARARSYMLTTRPL